MLRPISEVEVEAETYAPKRGVRRIAVGEPPDAVYRHEPEYVADADAALHIGHSGERARERRQREHMAVRVA